MEAIVALSDLHQSKRGIAALTACLVQTINESDPTFQERFLKRLGEAYYEIRDNSPASDNNHEALEPLTWVQEYLTGFSRFTGQGEPFLAHYRP
ncbi:MAG: hypothetical protein JNK30_21085 [Phenylobacterium sp.]|uniref:hypothetical protein n=1 Tax=Phenylobacterium sp. TaxID=1871053 RepID=UPI001A5E0854|nr:hypothetical protein [Phenylobacterium sp.]MBL8773895.1 hypothetical protein [Phenylobacterium sp.]